VIEAIPEELDLKRDAFRQLDAAAEPSTILATNTSSLSVGSIAEATNRPGRVVGMHFFNPVPLMGLVEIIGASRTDRDVVEAAAGLARQLGKTPVEAADTPGFIVNRVARPFYLEALRILGEGAAFSNHCRHGSAGRVDGPAREQRMGRYLHAGHHRDRRDMQLFAEVSAGHNVNHSGHRLGCAGIDGNYFRVRVGATQQRHVEHSR